MIRILPVLRMHGLHGKRLLLAKLHICDSENCLVVLIIMIENFSFSLSKVNSEKGATVLIRKMPVFPQC